MKFTNEQLTIAESQHYHIMVFDEMTKCERKIACAYVALGEKVLLGEYDTIIEKRSTIAKRARCSESSVRNFIRKYEGIVFKHDTRRRTKSYKHDSNKYYLNKEFLEVMLHLRINNYLYRWEEKRLEVLKGLVEDNFFLCSKTCEFYRLRTTILPAAFLWNLPAIKSYLSSSIYICKNTTYRNLSESKKIKKEFAVFGEIPLTYAQKTRLLEYNAIADIKEARRQYDSYVYTWKQNVIYPYCFVEKQAHKNYIQRKRKK